MKAILFDLDGTLCNTLEDLAISTNYALKRMSLPERELNEYQMFVGNGVYKQLERASHNHYSDELLDIYLNHYQKHYLDHTRPYDGMLETLQHLSKTYKLACITNKPHDIAKEMVNTLFPNLFECVYGGSSLYPKKPDITSLKLACEDMNIEVQDCIFIGDSEVDINTGKNAHIKTIGCAWGFRGKEELERAGADFIVNTPIEIERIVHDCCI